MAGEKRTRSGIIKCRKCGKPDLPAVLTIRTTKAKSAVTFRKHFKWKAAPEKCAGGSLTYGEFPTWAKNAVRDLPA
jgi:hypothetical protein